MFMQCHLRYLLYTDRKEGSESLPPFEVQLFILNFCNNAIEERDGCPLSVMPSTWVVYVPRLRDFLPIGRW